MVGIEHREWPELVFRLVRELVISLPEPPRLDDRPVRNPAERQRD